MWSFDRKNGLTLLTRNGMPDEEIIGLEKSNNVNCIKENTEYKDGEKVLCFWKQDQKWYEADIIEKRSKDGNDQCKMFLMRVCLGDVYTTPQNIEKLTRPPCKSGCIGVCTDHPDLFDSVVGEWPGMCREFTVYDRAKCYPEYIITYTIP